MRGHLIPLWKAQLVAEISPPGTPDRDKAYGVGRRWEAVLGYVETLREVRASGHAMNDLATEGWLRTDSIPLR